MSPILLSVALNVALAIAWFLAGATWQGWRRRRPGGRFAMVAPDDDPHQHCDRHPVRCTWMRLGDSARDNLKLMARYSDALGTVARCPKCPGCAMTAKTALAAEYEPD